MKKIIRKNMKKRFKPSEEGKRIRALRKKLGLTLTEFWDATGINPHTLQKLESGESQVTVSKARLISTLLIYRLGLLYEEASEDIILYGENKPKIKSLLSDDED